MEIISRLTKIKMIYVMLVLFLALTLTYYLNFETVSKFLILLFLLSSLFGSLYAKSEISVSSQSEVKPVEEGKTEKLIKEEVIAEP